MSVALTRSGLKRLAKKRPMLGGFAPQLELLEARLVMSFTTLSTVEQNGLLFAFERNGISSRLLADPIVQQALNLGSIDASIYSQKWVVEVASGTDISSWVNRVGNIFTASPVSAVPNTYVLATNVGIGELTRFYSQIMTAGSVVNAYPEISLPMSRLRYLPTDPLFPQQWWLRNTGQSGGTAGEDIDVTNVWGGLLPNGITGAGVQVGVVDDGLEFTHPDLANNYLASASFDFIANDFNPTPGFGESHGTSVAGIIGAVEGNGIGVVGSAFNAQLAGLRVVTAGLTDALAAQAVTYQPNVIDVYSNSWGPPDGTGSLNVDFDPYPLVSAAIAAGATGGRNGLGNIYVWAAGNGRDFDDNSNYDELANSRYAIAVAALNDNGVYTFYSEPGANLLVSAYGGDGPAPDLIVTTDLVGFGNLPGPGGDYTNGFNGTSAATPMVSGVVALMLQANPNLTYRDVRKILALSARLNDPGDPDWTTNAAGHPINHNYGYGAVDGAAAVATAQSWTNLGPEVTSNTGPITVNRSIGSGQSVTSSFTVTDPINIESVEITVNIQDPQRNRLRITLISPAGTQSILAEERVNDIFAFDGYQNWTFSTARLIDEYSVGTWQLVVSDEFGVGVNANFQDWSLSIHGTAASTVSIQSFTALDAAQLGTLQVTYVVTNRPADPFQIVIYLSQNARFDAADIPVGPTQFVNAPADLAIGAHVRTFSGAPFSAALADLKQPFVLAVANPAQALALGPSSNQDKNFIGAYQDATTPSPLVVRGRDPLDRTGGNPNDTVVVSSGPGTVIVSGSVFAAPVAVALGTVTDIRVLTVGGDDTVIGTGAPDITLQLRGGDGRDSLVGGPGDDQINGGRGNDTMAGGAGDDTYLFSAEFGDDLIDEAMGGGLDTIDLSEIEQQIVVVLDPDFSVPEGTANQGAFDTAQVERIITGKVNDTFLFGTNLEVGGGNATLDGGPGTNTVDYSRSLVGVTVNLQTGQAPGVGQLIRIQEVIGAVGRDNTLIGTSGEPLPGSVSTSATDEQAAAESSRRDHRSNSSSPRPDLELLS